MTGCALACAAAALGLAAAEGGSAGVGGGRTGLRSCPAGFTPHEPGFWNNAYPGPAGHPPFIDNANGTVPLCAKKCRTWLGGSQQRCVAFEINTPGGKRSMAACYLFLGETQPPFTFYDNPGANVTTCVVDGYKPPPPPPPPPQRGKTTGHPFPRLSNCWGDDPYISDAMWDYVGFPNMSNATWGDYDVHYLNPFDSCCWLKEIDR